MKIPKIKFHNTIYKAMSNTVSIWWLLTPTIKRYWSGKIIHIGLRGWTIEFDFRGINTIEDFRDAMLNKK